MYGFFISVFLRGKVEAKAFSLLSSILETIMFHIQVSGLTANLTQLLNKLL